MNSTEKDNIIQKAICCSGTLGKNVADMLLSGNKCADHELQKLILLNSYIETLGCYQAPLEVSTYTVVAGTPVLSTWSLLMTCETYTAVPTPADTISLTINGVTTSVVGDSIKTVGDLLEDILDGLGFTYVSTGCVDGYVTYSITALCDTETMTGTWQYTIVMQTSGNFTCNLVTEGNCSDDTLETTVTTTEYTNCLTEDQADDIATQISKICDLCDEH